MTAGPLDGIELEMLSATGGAEELRWAARRAAEVLEAGGIVVHPTETVYGLGGDGSALNNAVIARIKRRDPHQPLILLTPGVEALDPLVEGLTWSEDAAGLAARFWPGPLTLVLPCRSAPLGIRGEGGGVAVRVSSNPVVQAILEVWGAPMTSTSANLADQAPARNVEAAVRVLGERTDLRDLRLHALAVDGGLSPESGASTIVSLLGVRPRLLREGPVQRAELEKIVPGIEG